MSFVIDEIRPISKFRQFGYDSPEAAAQDWNNLQPAHYCCNQAKGAKVVQMFSQSLRVNLSDGAW